MRVLVVSLPHVPRELHENASLYQVYRTATAEQYFDVF